MAALTGVSPAGVESVGRTLGEGEDEDENDSLAPPDLVESLVFLRNWTGSIDQPQPAHGVSAGYGGD